mmetsp:Transcript_23532/g.42436  ORF Transcript_23532/g.42436 Transcript_23532/m.42436 type:complete len:113 (+) Transcript_23532:2350-2688(+)
MLMRQARKRVLEGSSSSSSQAAMDQPLVFAGESVVNLALSQFSPLQWGPPKKSSISSTPGSTSTQSQIVFSFCAPSPRDITCGTQMCIASFRWYHFPFLQLIYPLVKSFVPF